MRAPRSIRGKLARLVLVSVGLALGVTTLFGLWQETRRYASTKRETLLSTAEVFAAAVSKAVADQDGARALQAIRAIGRVPRLVYAEIEDRSGASLAQMGSAVRLAGDVDLGGSEQPTPLRLLASRTVQVSAPVIESGRPVGRIVLVSETSGFYDGLISVLLTAGAGSALAVAIGLLLSFRLQRSITRPLIALADTMAKTTRQGSYGATVEVTSDDETATLAASFNSLTREIRDATNEIIAREEETILRLCRAAEQRDDQTGEHILRVAKLCRIVAQGLDLGATASDDLYRAAPMHDVGKIAVPDAILFKPGRLDAVERREMEKHAEQGYEILRDSSSALIQLAAEIALTHHERWDGAGYPRKLAGEAIPLCGRITAIADVCDALATTRPYKPAWSLTEVKRHLLESSGSHFDPACVRAMIERWDEVEQVYAAVTPHADRRAVAAA